jgi:hypothetical protein
MDVLVRLWASWPERTIELFLFISFRFVFNTRQQIFFFGDPKLGARKPGEMGECRAIVERFGYPVCP